jgi:hypothetical protein
MGLIVSLEFGSGPRQVEITYGLTPSARMIRFIDDAPVGPGSPESALLDRYKSDGLNAILDSKIPIISQYFHAEWVEAFVDAVLEQGPEAFGDTLDAGDIARMLYDHAYDHNDYDYIQHVIEFQSEDDTVIWMLKDLVDAIETHSYHHPSVGTVARAMVGYVKPEEIEVRLNESGEVEDTRRTVKYGDYTVSVRGRKIATWTEESRYEIDDPLNFGGYADDDFDIHPEGGAQLRRNALDFLSEFDVELPNMTEPSAPGHPEPVEHGDYGLVHEFGEKFSMMEGLAGTWQVAQFEKRYNTMDAAELAKEIYENISYPTHVALTPVRRLEPEEAAEIAANFEYMTAYAAMSGEPAPREWERTWKRLDELNEED